MAQSNTQARITAIARTLLARRGGTTVPGSQASLREAGLNIAELMAVVEAEFGITAPQGAVMRGSFETVAAIEALVSRKVA
jgi:hypothetical protein